MSATDIPIDVDILRDEIRKTYTEVADEQEREFIFPTGRAWARELGYPEPELGRVPEATVESFAGVANHWTLGRINPGSVVLDLGCGAGTDLLIAAQMTGPTGRVIGVDMTSSMLSRARASAQEMGLEGLELHESLIEATACRSCLQICQPETGAPHCRRRSRSWNTTWLRGERRCSTLTAPPAPKSFLPWPARPFLSMPGR